MDKFPGNDMVSAIVRFSRCLFAQLHQQKLEFTPSSYPPIPTEDETAAQAAELGYKLAIGFEILSQDQDKQGQLDSLLAEGAQANWPWADAAPSTSSMDWMFVSPEDIDDLLGRRQASLSTEYQPGQPLPEGNVFDEMVQQMKKFVTQSSEYDGIDESLSDDEGSDFYGDEDDDIREAMTEMDSELAQTNIGGGNPEDEELNMLRNFIQSYESQYGSAGPVSNLFSQLARKNRKK